MHEDVIHTMKYYLSKKEGTNNVDESQKNYAKETRFF